MALLERGIFSQRAESEQEKGLEVNERKQTLMCSQEIIHFNNQLRSSAQKI